MNNFTKTLKNKLSSFGDSYYFYIELVLLFLAVYIRLMLSITAPFGDSPYFSDVMKKLTSEPFFGFYGINDITYPPLFNYLYYLIACLLLACGIPITWKNRIFVFAVKFPCICAEFAMIALVYHIAGQHVKRPQKRLILLFLLLFNPGYVFVTSYVCQVDALYTFFIVLTVYLIMTKHLKAAYFTFAAGIMFKFQTLFIAPVLALAIIEQVILTNFSWKRFFTHLFTGLTAIGCMFLSYLPFIIDLDNLQLASEKMTSNFTNSVSGYGRASTNAYNFWTLLGYNLEYDSNYLGFFSCFTWGTLFIVLIVVICCILFFYSNRQPWIYPALTAFMVSGIFCFSMRMMARYLYPAVILLYLAYAGYPGKKRLRCSLLFALAFFANVWCDYMVYPYAAYRKDLILPYILSAFMLGCFGYSVYVLIRESRQDESIMK